MAKFSILAITVIIFTVSYFYGKSIRVVEVEKTTEKTENVISAIKKVNKALKEDGVLKFDKKVANELSQQEKSLEKLSDFKKQKRYGEIAEIAATGTTDNPIIETIIGLENPQEIDHNTMESLNEKFQAYALKNPDSAFGEIKNILDSKKAKTSGSLRGNLFVAASFIPGKEEEVKELTRREMESNIISPQNKNIPIGGDNPLPKSNGEEEMAVVLAYNAFLAASHKDTREIASETIEILKKQPNETLRKKIAISFDRAFPTHRLEMLKKLEEEGIKLFPDDFILPEEG
jgi:hypothetical protein